MSDDRLEKQWYDNLKNYRYEGHKLNVGTPNPTTAYSLAYSFTMKISYEMFRFDDPHIENRALNKIGALVDKANKTFGRWYRFVTGDEISISSQSFTFEPFYNTFDIVLKRYLWPEHTEQHNWEAYKKMLDKFFYIIRTLLHSISYETPEVKMVVVGVNDKIIKQHPWVNPEKQTSMHIKPIQENRSQSDENTALALSNKLRNYSFKLPNGELIKNALNVIGTEHSHTIFANQEIVVQHPQSYLIFGDNILNQNMNKILRPIVDKAQINITRLSTHLWKSGYPVYIAKTERMFSLGARSLEFKAQLGITINEEFFEQVLNNWNPLEQVINKFFFITYTLINKINELRKNVKVEPANMQNSLIYKGQKIKGTYAPI